MPIIKSAKKRLKQSRVRQQRNYRLRSELKTVIKNIEQLLKKGEVDTAIKRVSEAYKIIDTAAKKNIIHKKNASRKKSYIMKSIKRSSETKSSAPAAAPAKKTEEKTAEK